MAKWQPPIPAGAMYSKAARALGPALPLLAYCYDLVQRDGWLDLDLTEAAGDMEEPYPTVKRWWKVVKEGPFFCETIDRGRRGWRVKFQPVWIDLRILSTRPIATEPSSTTQGSEMILEETQKPEGHFKDISRTNEGSEMILENNVYGTQDSYLAKEVDDAKISRTSPPKKKTEKPTPKPIREALADVCGIGRISTREQQLQVNQSAAQIWKEQERAGIDAERTANDIRYVGKHWRAQHWKGKKGDVPWPKDIREHWEVAIEARSKNGHTNGQLPTAPAKPAGVQSAQESAARMMELLNQQRGK